RIGGIPELVKDRINGLLFKPNNPKDLYEKMTLIVDNPYLIEKMKENIRPPKSIEENAKEMEEIYASLKKR
ncbi:MAG: glycosyltransferase, partial [Candidatus Omnitrophica bacterium]|nr:glycosyltransferase [Candidatus Omnitrophota bacterium]